MCIKVPVFGLAGKVLGIGPKVSVFGAAGEAAEALTKKKKKGAAAVAEAARSHVINRSELGYRSLLS